MLYFYIQLQIEERPTTPSKTKEEKKMMEKSNIGAVIPQPLDPPALWGSGLADPLTHQ